MGVDNVRSLPRRRSHVRPGRGNDGAHIGGGVDREASGSDISGDIGGEEFVYPFFSPME